MPFIVFQIYCPNMNVLETQTIHRMCQFPKVLPEKIGKLWGTSKEKDAKLYASERVMKLNKKASYEKRFKELKKMVKDDPDKLLVNIFDEAHHSATSRDRSGKFVEKENFIPFLFIFLSISSG